MLLVVTETPASRHRIYPSHQTLHRARAAGFAVCTVLDYDKRGIRSRFPPRPCASFRQLWQSANHASRRCGMSVMVAPKSRRIFLFVFACTTCAVCVWYVASHFQWAAIQSTLREVNFINLTSTLLATHFAYILMRAWRWD